MLAIGGIYSLPSFLSPETKYLLTSMLVVDPLKRITIAEIRQNSWFNVGLPDYLKPLPQGSTEDLFCDLQEDIIEELMKKMNFSKETIVQALEERQNNQIKVAYQLVVDHRRMIENGTVPIGSGESLFFALLLLAAEMTGAPFSP